MKTSLMLFLSLILIIISGFTVHAQENSVWDYFWLETLAGTVGAAVGFYGSFGLEQIGVCSDGLMCAMTLNALTATVGVAIVGGLNDVEGNLWLAPVGGILGSFLGGIVDLIIASSTKQNAYYTIHSITGLFSAVGYNLGAKLKSNL